MKSVVIYTSPLCGYCHSAKRLLKQKGVTFHEINVMGNAQKKQEMMSRARGRHTVPQIFIGEEHIGGCDELHALDHRGKLDMKLAS